MGWTGECVNEAKERRRRQGTIYSSRWTSSSTWAHRSQIISFCCESSFFFFSFCFFSRSFIFFFIFLLSVPTFFSIHFVLACRCRVSRHLRLWFCYRNYLFSGTTRFARARQERKKGDVKKLLLLASASRETQKVFHEYNLRFLCSTIFHSLRCSLSPGRLLPAAWAERIC